MNQMQEYARSQLRVVWNRILLDEKMQLPDDVRVRINELFEEATGEPRPDSDRQPSNAAVDAAYGAYVGDLSVSLHAGLRNALEAAYRVDALRPLLSRERLAIWLYNHRTDGPESWASNHSEGLREGYRQEADELLALLNGAES